MRHLFMKKILFYMSANASDMANACHSIKQMSAAMALFSDVRYANPFLLGLTMW